MIDTIFYLFVGITVVSLFFSQYLNKPFLSVLGSAFFFIAGTMLLPGLGVEFHTGNIITTINATATSVLPIYTTYTNTLYGVLICFAGVGIFMATWQETKFTM
jgi:hypothetical protein